MQRSVIKDNNKDLNQHQENTNLINQNQQNNQNDNIIDIDEEQSQLNNSNTNNININNNKSTKYKLEIDDIDENKYKLKYNSYIQLKIQQFFKHQSKQQLIQTIICIIFLFFAYLLFGVFITPRCEVEAFPNQEDCVENVVVAKLSTWIVCILSSAIIIYSIILLTILKKVHKLNGILAGLEFIYIVRFIYGKIDINTISIRNYETGHQLGMLGFVALFTVVTLYVFLWKSLLQKYRKIFYIFILIQLFYILSFINKAIYSCDNWEKGLVSEIDQSDIYCQIKIPKVCWPVIVDNIFNLSSRNACQITNMDEKRAQVASKYLLLNNTSTLEEKIEAAKNLKVLGWPLTAPLPGPNRISENHILDQILQGLKQYDTVQDVFNDGREVAIDLEKLTMEFNVERNLELVKKQQEIQTDSISKNVIIIYLDTLSRPHFMRKLKKTTEFLRKYADYNSQEYKDQKLNKKLFENYRFHSIDRKTQSNAFKFRYNITTEDWRYDRVELNVNKKIESLLNNIKDAGYILGHSANSMSLKSNLRFQKIKGHHISEYFHDDPAHHEMFLFDPNYVFEENMFGVEKGANSIYRRCLYHEDTNKFVFDYGEKFLDAYKEDKKFLLLEFTDGHELTSEVIQYVDDNLYNFLVSIEKKGHMEKDTIVYLLSDHGQHLISNVKQLQSIFQRKDEDDVYTIERMLPFFYMMVTNDLLQKYDQMEEILYKNQQRIFGMAEYRQTLLTNAYGLENTSLNPFYNTKNLFVELPISDSCLDIGIVSLPDPKSQCSCLPQEGYEVRVEQKKQEAKKKKKN